MHLKFKHVMAFLVKSKLFHNVSFLSISQMSGMVVPLVSGIWIAGQLSEQDFGAYRLLLILLTYLSYSMLGIDQKLLYKLPESIGKGAINEIQKISSTLHSALTLNRAIIFVVAVCLALFDVRVNDVSIGFGWIILGIGFAIDGWGNLYEMVIRAFQRFMYLSIIRMGGAISYLIFLYFLLKMLGLGIEGILISLALSGGVKILLAQKSCNLKFKCHIAIMELVNDVKYGFPLKINSIIWTLLITINIWLTSYYLSPRDVGILGYAMMISSAFTAAAGVLTEMLSVRFIQYLGKCNVKGGSGDRFNATHSISMGWVGLNLMIAISTLSFFSLVIYFFMPKYSSAWGIIVINIIGYYSYSIIDTVSNSEIISNRVNKLTKLFLTMLAIESISSIAVCWFDPTLENITIVQSACLSLLAGWVAYQHWESGLNEGCNKNRFLKFAVLAGLGITVLILSRYIVTFELGIGRLMQSLAILFLLATPILWFSYKGFLEFFKQLNGVELKNEN